MKAIVYHGQEDFRYGEVADPQLQYPNDAIVRITRTAICGSDLHLWHAPAWPGAEPGFCVGHEFLGVIEDVGSAVQKFRKGDRVLVACTTGCGSCHCCRQGIYNSCTVTTADGKQNIFGFSNALPGGQAEAARVPFADANLFKVPAALSDESALFLTDILPTGYMGADFARVGPGDIVVVFGCGPVGTFAQMCADLRGAARVIAVDLDEQRLARARERGYDTINPSKENLPERVFALSNGRGADAVIEAVGLAELVQAALPITRPGGRIAVIGAVFGNIEVPWGPMFRNSLTLSSSLITPQAYIPRLLPLIETGKLDPTSIISHRLPLSRGREAYDIFAGHKDSVLKVVLTP